MVAVATPLAKVNESMAFRAKPLTRQASSIVTSSPQLLAICGAPAMPLLKYLTVRSVIGIPAERFQESGGVTHAIHVASGRVDIPANQQREVVVGHGLRPLLDGAHHPDRELRADGVEAQHVAGGPAVAPSERRQMEVRHAGSRVVGGAVGTGVAGGDHADVLADDFYRGAVGEAHDPAFG